VTTIAARERLPTSRPSDPSPTQPYALVHLVAQEMHKGLIESQVLDHMEEQARHGGLDAPQRVAVAFLEPARVALQSGARQRLRMLRRRAPHVKVVMLPYVSRFSTRTNARLLSAWLRVFARGDRLVLHCRSESAVLWAVALRQTLKTSAIVADFRGVWPDEMLQAKGVARLADADVPTRASYQDAVGNVRAALKAADAVLTVSTALRDWLEQHGGRPEETIVVPTCVPGTTYADAVRREVRSQLGISDKLVLVYAGTVTPYQHVADGFGAFARMAVAHGEPGRVHVLCITPDREAMRAAMSAAGVPSETMTILSVPQHEVARYLSAADAGFLLRADSIVNRVSVPVKLGEYLAAGVPVVISRVDGWLHHTIEDASAGWSIDWFGSGDAERNRLVTDIMRDLRDGPSRRNAAIALCRHQFTWAAYTRQVRTAYANALARTRSVPMNASTS